MPLSIGQTFEKRYRIEALLGQGGFGAIYLAWDTNLDGQVAIKENLSAPTDNQKQFKLEAKLLFNLRHPNLPRVIDLFTIPGQGQYLVMDYIEGRDLKDILVENHGPLGETQAISWLGQVSDALIYLHEQTPPIIHRDVKPSNIRITTQGKAVLVDFGIAKVLDLDGHTTSGARAITPNYSSPEQIGQSATDAQSDIYSLGATAYHMLTGRPPPPAMSVISGMAKPAEPVHIANPQVSPELSEAIAKAMMPNREQRTKTVAAFKEALFSQNNSLGTGLVLQSSLTRALPPLKPVEKAPATEPAVEPENETSVRLPFWSLWSGGLILVGLVAGLLLVILILATLIFGQGLFSPDRPITISTAPHLSLSGLAKTGASDGLEPGNRLSPTLTQSSSDGSGPTATTDISASLTLASPGKFSETPGESPTTTPGGSPPAASFTLTASPTLPPSSSTTPTRTQTPTPIATNTSTHTPTPTKTPTSTPTNTSTTTKTATQPPTLGEVILFSSDKDGGVYHQIYAIHPSGASSSLLRLTENDYDEHFPSCSSDGNRLAFSSNRSGNWDIILSLLDGSSEPQELTSSSAIDTDPAISPNGAMAAYMHRDSNGEYSIYRLTISTGSSTRLTSGRGDNEHPVWSPDGLYIYFDSNRNNSRGEYDIWRMQVNGSNAVNLTGAVVDSGGYKWPAISPDGSKLAFASEHIGGNYEIFILEMGSSNLIRVTYNQSAEDTQPVWSPDGKTLAFSSNRDGDFDIYTISAGANDTTIEPYNVTNNSADDREPDWEIILLQDSTPLLEGSQQPPLAQYPVFHFGFLTLFTPILIIPIAGRSIIRRHNQR